MVRVNHWVAILILIGTAAIPTVLLFNHNSLVKT